MDFSLLLPLVLILAADVLFFITVLNNKLEIKGKNQYAYMTPLVITVYIISLVIERNLTFENILIAIGLVIFALLGNHSGVGRKGILAASWFTKWEKIDKVYVENQGEKCILHFSNRKNVKKLIFKKEDEDKLKKYLDKIKREIGFRK
jgi:hypothetical protein